ncbi:MAG: amidohydrolase [Planctomycetes bacterium]|nr:amidohydrolase [Planctomycetota bacterium]
MIVDCFTHTWESGEELGRGAPLNGRHVLGLPDPAWRGRTGTVHHFASLQPASAAIVLGFKSHYLGAEIANRTVAAYVSNHPDRLIGFAGVDPSRPREAIDDLRHARAELNMRGAVVAPAAQDFHPQNSQAMLVYAEAARLGLPLLFHTGVRLSAATKLEYAQPVLLDEVARELPELRIVVAHMGFPWVQETIALLAKHGNVFAEISWLLHQPWQAYQALLSAYQFGVTDKLLFGSGFPYASAAQCIEDLYDINHLCHGTNLPTIPREHLRGIVERDSLSLLGIATQQTSAPPATSPQPAEEELEAL